MVYGKGMIMKIIPEMVVRSTQRGNNGSSKSQQTLDIEFSVGAHGKSVIALVMNSMRLAPPQ